MSGYVGLVQKDGVTPVDGTNPLFVGGSTAAGSTDSGNPVKVGGKFNVTPPTLTDGQRGDLQLDNMGSLSVTLRQANNGTAVVVVAPSDGQSLVGVGLRVLTVGELYNGTTGDMARSAQGAVNANTGIGVMAVEEAGRTFSNITTATTTTSKSGKGFLHSVTINTFVASATITIFDNTAASGSKIATITLPSTITSLGPITLMYNVAFSTGLTVVTSGATDITVAYR